MFGSLNLKGLVENENVICMKRTKLEKGQVYLTQEDANCRNYYEPIGGEQCLK